MRTTLLLIIALVATGCATTIDPASGTDATTMPAPPSSFTATAPPGDLAEVVRVFDGDSLIVAVNGQEREVRLIGINAPEGDECHGDIARSTLEQLVGSGQLVLVADGENSDQYGRLLRYLYVDGLNVNLALIANGDAVVLQGDHSLDPEFASIADATADDGIGMWAPDACGSTAPPRDVQIADYTYNPPGRDEDNMNGEWVAVANVGTDTIDMTGWVLRDESTQHRFRFHDGFSLDSGDEVTIHTGCGQDTTSDLYWCTGDPVWSNGGDSVILQNSEGNIVAHERFSGEY